MVPEAGTERPCIPCLCPLSLPTRPSCLSSFITHGEITPWGEAACSEGDCSPLPPAIQPQGLGQRLAEFLV